MLDDYQEVGLERIAEAFHEFAEKQCKDASPFYAHLAHQAAEAPEIMRLASYTRRGQPIQNMLFAAVHYLLLKGENPELAAFYPSINPTPTPGDLFPLFYDFCMRQADRLRELLVSRSVQTNEVGRCACLLPAFNIVAQMGGDQPLAMIEVGTSAGLNLLWDQYHYQYNDGRSCGNKAALVQLECNSIGEGQPPIPEEFPRVASRQGIDLTPIYVRDDDAVTWLRALVWPDQTRRYHLLEHAIAIARQHPQEIVRGNALEVLPESLKNTPEDTTVCVYHSFALNQFGKEARAEFYAILETFSQQRPVYCLAMEWMGTPTSELVLSVYKDGSRQNTPLAYCDAHGRWLGWRNLSLE